MSAVEPITTDIAARARRFADLHEGPDIFVMPNPWDAGSARVLAGMGFPALATTSAGFAFSMGYVESAVGRDAMLENARQIVDAVDVPVSADLRDGLGKTPADLADTVRLAGVAGLCGCSVEDVRDDAPGTLYEFDQAVDRVTAAVEAARNLPHPFQLTARAEGLLYGKGDLDDIIKRLQAFEAAGADVLFAPGLPDLDSVAKVCAAVRAPVNVLVGLGGLNVSVSALANVGVRRISVGAALARHAFGALIGAAQEISQAGTFSYTDLATPFSDLNAYMRTVRNPDE